MDGMCEFETVHGARHVNISKDHSDVAPVLEYAYYFISICSFSDLKTRMRDRSDGIQANQ